MARVSRRADTRHIAVLTVIRRIVAAIRLWRGRARSQQQLRELSDHMLKDIGLRREDVGYEFPKPFWHLACSQYGARRHNGNVPAFRRR